MSKPEVDLQAYEQFLLRGQTLPASCAVVLPSFANTAEFTAVLVHEYFHFLQLSGTPAGRTLSFQYAWLGNAAGAFLRDPPKPVAEEDRWYFPIILWGALEPNEVLARALREHLRFLAFNLDTLHLHLGWLPFRLQSNAWGDERTWPWSTLAPKEGILPQIGQGEDTEFLGTLDLMETAAAIQGLRMHGEATSAERGVLWFDLLDPERDLLRRMPPRYSAALRYAEQRSNLPDSLLIPAVLLAVDVALGGGIELLSAHQKDFVAWEDYHPGWRYVGALSAIEEMNAVGRPWPRSEDDLSAYILRIYDMRKWSAESRHPYLYAVSHEDPSRSDRVRVELAEEACTLKAERPSLWSVGPRQSILDTLLTRFKPPLLMEFGRDSLRPLRQGIDAATISSLWWDTQLNHVAWQVLDGGLLSGTVSDRVECFPWSVERTNAGCDASDGSCRYYPPQQGGSLPASCPMADALHALCGDYWHRLRPLSARS